MPHDESNVEFCVDILSLNDHIGNNMDWTVFNSFYNIWYVSPSSYHGTFGSWFDINNDIRFIGIRMNI